MYQRSADMGLGVPFNIASYALLTRLVAQVCGLKAGDFVHSIGDAHVYLNHVDALKEQIQRTPKEFPRLLINPEVLDIDSFKFSDFTIENYNPLSTIRMKMAVWRIRQQEVVLPTDSNHDYLDYFLFGVRACLARCCSNSMYAN